MNEFLPKAKASKFAVGQFNMNNLEFAQAIVEAAMEEKSPFIYGVSEGALKYMGIEFTVAIAKAAAKKSGLPIALASGPWQQLRSCDEMYPRWLLARLCSMVPTIRLKRTSV